MSKGDERFLKKSNKSLWQLRLEGSQWRLKEDASFFFFFLARDLIELAVKSLFLG